MKRTVKSKEDLLEWFKEHKWTETHSGGYEKGDDKFFALLMFDYCGTEIKVRKYSSDDYDFVDSNWYWKKGWFVKKEKKC